MSKTQLYGQKINPYFGERLSGENYLIMFCAEEADGCFWQVSEGCASDIDTCIMMAALEPEESFAKGHCVKIFTPNCKEKKNYTSRDALIESGHRRYGRGMVYISERNQQGSNLELVR